nr:hypothetical protein CFP56_32442 [Quercus suber]
MRIVKAISFGATWCKGWDHNVTHVIVDKDIEYDLLLRYLKLDVLPTTVVLVSENYPSECICYRTMLDAKQRQFMVKGFTPSTTLSKPSVIFSSSGEPNASLELKSAGQAVIARQFGIPATDHQSEILVVASATLTVELNHALKPVSLKWSSVAEDLQHCLLAADPFREHQDIPVLFLKQIDDSDPTTLD